MVRRGQQESCDSGGWGSGRFWTPSQDCQAKATLPFPWAPLRAVGITVLKVAVRGLTGVILHKTLTTAVGSWVQVWQAPDTAALSRR